MSAAKSPSSASPARAPGSDENTPVGELPTEHEATQEEQSTVPAEEDEPMQQQSTVPAERESGADAAGGNIISSEALYPLYKSIRFPRGGALACTARTGLGTRTATKGHEAPAR